MVDVYRSILPLLHQTMSPESRSSQATSGANQYLSPGSQWEKYATDKRAAWLLVVMFEIIAQQLLGVAHDIWPQLIKRHALAVVERDEPGITQLHHVVLGRRFGQLHALGKLGEVHLALGQQPQNA